MKNISTKQIIIGIAVVVGLIYLWKKKSATSTDKTASDDTSGGGGGYGGADTLRYNAPVVPIVVVPYQRNVHQVGSTRGHAQSGSGATSGVTPTMGGSTTTIPTGSTTTTVGTATQAPATHNACGADGYYA